MDYDKRNSYRDAPNRAGIAYLRDGMDVAARVTGKSDPSEFRDRIPRPRFVMTTRTRSCRHDETNYDERVIDGTRVLPPQEAAAVLAAYSARHPRAWAAMRPVLEDILGDRGCDVESGLPVVALESDREG